MSRSAKITIIIIILILLIIGLVLFFVGRSLLENPDKVTIATIWDVPDFVIPEGEYDEVNLDMTNATRRVQKARAGFVKGLEAMDDSIELEELFVLESSDIGKYTTNIANTCSSDDILLTVGALKDESTMYASMEMNFFNIPMLIPFSDGDLSVEGSDSGYSIRMTPVAQNYADYIGRMFTSNIFDYIYNFLFANRPAPSISGDVAVFFADNFNGHETAVKITQQIMDNGFDVETYEPFGSDQLLSRVQSVWKTNPEQMSGLESVIIIGADFDPFPELNDVWHIWADQNLYPAFVMVGYSPDNVTPELAAANNVYTVQQALDFSNCPAEIVNRTEAAGYAAGIILSRAIEDANKTMASNSKGFFKGLNLLLMTTDQRMSAHQDYLNSYRTAIRTALFDMDEFIPCYGNSYFNVAAEIRENIELVHYTGVDQYVKVDPSVIFNRIIDDVRQAYGITDK